MDEERSGSAAHVQYIETVDEEELQADSARHLSRGGRPSDQQCTCYEVVCFDWAMGTETPALGVQHYSMLALPSCHGCGSPIPGSSGPNSGAVATHMSENVWLAPVSVLPPALHPAWLVCCIVLSHPSSSCIKHRECPSCHKTVMFLQMPEAARWASLQPRPLCCLGHSPLQ